MSENKRYRVKVTDVDWDLGEWEGADELDMSEFGPELPSEIDIDIPEFVTEGLDSEEVGPAIENWLSDEISDLYGFCHNGFNWKFV